MAKKAKKTKPKKVSAEKSTASHAEDVQPKASHHEKSSFVSEAVDGLTQKFNLLIVIIVAMFIFQAYTFYLVKDLKKNGGVTAGTESPLSEENLENYAKDVGLNKKDYEKCFADEATLAKVTADTQEGASLGVQGTPGFFINGRFLGGAFPFENFKEIIDKELAGTGSDNCADYSEELQQYCMSAEDLAALGEGETDTSPFKPQAVEVSAGEAPVYGKADAKVTIVEFSDFECPYCARAYDTVNQIKEAYPNDVKIVYKHFPLSNIHPNAENAAKAAVCAQEQGKFWEMHDKLFESQTQQQ